MTRRRERIEETITRRMLTVLYRLVDRLEHRRLTQSYGLIRILNEHERGGNERYDWHIR